MDKIVQEMNYLIYYNSKTKQAVGCNMDGVSAVYVSDRDKGLPCLKNFLAGVEVRKAKLVVYEGE